MSTIITDNPYSFTVADNMNINAVFEDNTGYLKTVVFSNSGSGKAITLYYNETGTTTPSSSESIGDIGYKYPSGSYYNNVSHITFTSAGYFYFRETGMMTFSGKIYFKDADTGTTIKTINYAASTSDYNRVKITSDMLCNLNITIS